MALRDRERGDRAGHVPAGDRGPARDRPVAGGLQVGAPGKVGLLELSLERSGSTTRVTRQYQQAPLHVYRPIHLDGNLPGMAFVFVQQYGDGYVHGDRCRIDIDCGRGAEVHLTTQAATNIYRAQRNFASQLVNLRAARGAVSAGADRNHADTRDNQWGGRAHRPVGRPADERV